MAIYVGYQSPTSVCSGFAQPGCKALMSWFLGNYADDGGVNSGIYNCRSVRGGGSPSVHGEGRAVDLGIRPYSAIWGWVLANWLVAHSAELGIQLVIWDRKVWSGSYPHAGWRPYGGTADHRDHIHAELAWWAATGPRALTVEYINSIANPKKASKSVQQQLLLL